MSADDDDLVAVFGVGAGQQPQDVAGLDLFSFLGDHSHARSGGEGRGGKAQAQIVQRVIGTDEQILGDGLRDQVGGDGLGYPGGLAVSGSPIWRGRSLSVQQQQPSDLVLNGLAVDLAFASVAAQRDLADHIESSVFVVQALVQPDDWSLSLSLSKVASSEGAIVLAVGVGVGEHCASWRGDRQDRRLRDASVGHAEGLKIGAVQSSWLQSILGKGGGDVIARGPSAWGARLATAQFVVGQVGQMLHCLLLVEREGGIGVVGSGNWRPHGTLHRDQSWNRLCVARDARAGRRRQLELLNGRLG